MKVADTAMLVTSGNRGLARVSSLEKRLLTLVHVTGVAMFLASDRADAITTVANESRDGVLD